MKIRSLMAGLLGTMFMAESASALSCMQPDIQRELKEAIESDKVYHIFVGYFDAPQIKLPFLNGDHPQIMESRSQTVSGTFTGYSMGKTRRADFKLERFPITVKTDCAAHWCGGVPSPEQKMIAFVEAQDDGPSLLTMGPCPYMSHSYSPEKVQTLRRGL